MTTTAVQEFFNKVSEDEALQAELAQALEEENDREAVTELAQSNGYEFTPEELWAEVQKRQAEAPAEAPTGELSDEELEQVAGGFTPTAAATPLTIPATAASVSITLRASVRVGTKVKW